MAADDYSISSNKSPISIKHVFNSNDKDSNVGYGNGWRLNYGQMVEYCSSLSMYRYIDEDGTRHYFNKDSSGAWKDEDGLNLTLTVDQSNWEKRYTIVDKNNNKMIFTGQGGLHLIIDKDGNAIAIYYNGDKILRIVDQTNRDYRLNWDNDVIKNITCIDPATKAEKVILSCSYSGKEMTGLTFMDGKTSSYAYNSDNELVSATNNSDGYRMTYDYFAPNCDGAPHRVRSIQEGNTDGTKGANLSISYGFNTTIFKDSKNRAETYQFNDWGNTLCIKDPDGNAQYSTFFHDNNINDKNNKLISDSKLQKTIVNYLKNHNAEKSTYWNASKWGNYAGTNDYSTEESYLGKQSIKIYNSNGLGALDMEHSTTVERGKTYTLSAYVKTKDLPANTSGGAKIFIGYTDPSGTCHYSQRWIRENSDWQRVEVSLDVPSDAKLTSGTSNKTNIWASVCLDSATGTAYYDCIQLEDGSIANRYNLIEDCDVSEGLDGSSSYFVGNSCISSYEGDGVCSINSLDSTLSQGLPPFLKNSVLKIVGKAAKQKAIYEDIKVSGNKGDTFVFGGWSKAYSVPSGKYGLALGFRRTDGSIQWSNSLFNQDCNDWQYTSNAVVSDSSYNGIVLYIMYYNEENTAYFDGLQIYKEEFGQSYSYDDKGNVISTKDLAKQNSKFEYDKDNNLIKTTDVKGNNFKYGYDNNHNITSATSAQNVVYSFTYDSYGNPKTSKVGGSISINASAQYTADGNYIKSVTDSSGNTVNYNYNESTGYLDDVTDAKGNKISNTYDVMGNLTGTSKNASGTYGAAGVPVTNTYTYSKDRIDNIKSNTADYSFGYDSLGNNTSVKVGNQNLITNEYDLSTGNLKKATYGNGQAVSSTYDNLDRVTSKLYYPSANANPLNLFTYEYDANSNLGYKQDKVNNVNYKYIYDLSERLNRVEDSNNNSYTFTFDLNSNLSKLKETLKGVGTYTTSYSYDKDNRPVSTIYSRDLNGTGSLNDSVAADFNFDNSDATDSSGNMNDGVYHGSPSFVESGHIGKALKLNSATKDWVESNDFTVPESFSVSMWIKPVDLTSSQCMIGKHDKNGGNIFLVGMWNNKFEVDLRSGSYLYDMSGGKIKAGEYQHILVTVNKINISKTSINVYCNGTSLGAQTVNDVIGNTTGKGWTIGQDWDGSTESDYYNGEIDEVKIIKKALSESEISSIYNDKSKLISIINNYDEIGRIKNKIAYMGAASFNTEYKYKNISGTETTPMVESINNNGKVINYTYDKNGNIETITSGDKTNKYYYNELSELIREDNKDQDRTYVYSYDAGGNILSKTEYAYTTGTPASPIKTISYTYGDSNWKDKLTNFNGKEITYDPIGNPLTYDGWSFTWEQGRQLASMNGNNQDISYKYDDSGVRTEKTVNGIVTKYHLVGDKVTYEDNGTDKIYYTYDASNKLVSMNLNGVEYYYIRNVQGDIIGLFDKTGAQVVSYSYDSWGKLISIDGSLKDSVGVKNSYRYRGYRYDTETGLYYLQSRYYNAEWGRFINADGILGRTGQLLSHNVFCYCNNDPVNNKDDNGFMCSRATRMSDDGGSVSVAFAGTVGYAMHPTHKAYVNNNKNNNKKNKSYLSSKNNESGDNYTTSIGFTFGGHFLLGGSITPQLNIDNYGHANVTISVSTGLGSSAISVGPVITFTNAKNLQALLEDSATVGASGSGGPLPVGLGVDVLKGNGYIGVNINLDVKAEPFFEAHWDATYTWKWFDID